MKLEDSATLPVQSVSVLWGTLQDKGLMPSSVQGMFTGADNIHNLEYP